MHVLTCAYALTQVVVTPEKLVDILAPELSREEELYAISLVDLASTTLGKDAGVLVAGDAFLEPQAVGRLALGVLTSGVTRSWLVAHIILLISIYM